MTIAEKAADYVVKIEQRDKWGDTYNYGMDQDFIDAAFRNKYLKQSYKLRQIYDSEVLAKKVYAEIFNNAGFNRFTNENVAVFLFDTWVQNPKTYRAILASILNIDYYPLVQYRMPYTQSVYDDVNNSDASDFLSTAVWLRHQITIFAHNKSDWQGIWNKRTIPLLKQYPLSCFTAQSGELLLKAADYSRNNDYFAKLAKNRYADLDTIKAKLKEVFKENLPAIGNPYSITDCVIQAPNLATVPMSTDDNTGLMIGLAIAAYFILKN